MGVRLERMAGPAGPAQGPFVAPLLTMAGLPAGAPQAYAAPAWRGNGVENNKHPMLERFLAEHPEVRFVDAYVNDLNTVERGKRIDRAALPGLFKRGMPLPGSMFALDIEGGTVEATGLGFADGDADRPCMPLPGP